MKGFLNFFSNRATTPVETRNYHTIYLVLSGLLFIGTMWSVLDEVTTRRPWKDTEEAYYNLSAQKWADRLKDATASFDSTSYNTFQSQLVEANAKLASPEFMGWDDQIRKLEDQLIDANRDFTFTKSKSDETYYFWKKSLHEGHEDLGLKKKVEDYAAQLAKFGARVDALTATHDSLVAMEKPPKDSVKAINKRIASLFDAINLAKSKITKAQTSSIVIHQVMRNGFDKSNFG